VTALEQRSAFLEGCDVMIYLQTKSKGIGQWEERNSEKPALLKATSHYIYSDRNNDYIKEK
jgi:hypothetical protein